MNFKFLGHLNTFAVIAQFYKLAPDPWGKTSIDEMTDDRLSHKTLLLRCQQKPTVENHLDDLPLFDRPQYDKWNSLKRLIQHGRKLVFADPWYRDMLDASAPMGKVCISVLAPKIPMQWHPDLGSYAARHFRFHVPLVTNPGCTVYCGNEQYHLPVGALVGFDHAVPHCAANWGEYPRSHLIFEIRRQDAPSVGE